MKIKDSFHTYAIITVLCWSLAYVFTRTALQHFSAYSLGFLRYFIASAVLIIVVAVTKMKLPQKRDAKWIILGGAVGFALYMMVFNKGCETVTASTSSVIIATAPIITALLANFVYKERLKYFQWLAIAVSFAGVAVLTLLNGILTINIGVAWLFAGAILLSVYNLLQRKLTKTYTGLQTATFSIFAGTAMLAVFAQPALAEIKTAPPVQLMYVAILGVFTSAIAYVTWSQAIARAQNTSAVSNYMFITPFLATLLGFLINGEKPDFATVVGGLIILGGLLMFNLGGRLYGGQRKKRAAENGVG